MIDNKIQILNNCIKLNNYYNKQILLLKNKQELLNDKLNECIGLFFFIKSLHFNEKCIMLDFKLNFKDDGYLYYYIKYNIISENFKKERIFLFKDLNDIEFIKE